MSILIFNYSTQDFFWGGGLDISNLWRILINYLLYYQYQYISFDLKTV